MSYPPPPDIRRCTRDAKKGGRCRSARLAWSRQILLPDPESCLGHLTGEERAAWEADRPRREAAGLMFDLAWHRLINSDPACWAWPPPTEAGLHLLRESHAPETRAILDRAGAWPGIQMADWHAGRCAICGHGGALVDDHDHQTGLLRGQLCRSCNTLEGMGHGGVFARYRERNPATICGVRKQYWNPFTREYAEPAPPPGDPWADNPMKQIDL